MNPDIFERQMKFALERLKLNSWNAFWSPSKSSKRGEIILEDHLIIIYDKCPAKAWDTFVHELIELKLRSVTNVYRFCFNALVDAMEKLVYERKEEFINELPDLFKVIDEFSPESVHS